MPLIDLMPDGTLIFNWDSLPEEIKKRTELRDKIFKELQEKYKPDEPINTKILFDANQYVIRRIRSVIEAEKKESK